MPARERYGVLRPFPTAQGNAHTPRAALAALALIASTQFQAKAADDIPTGKLPADAVPRHYALKFKVDPREDRFSGETHILVKLARPADRVFLHAQNLDIAKATVTAERREARCKGFAHPEAGVLEVQFGRTLAAGDIELAFEYTAPFNGKLEGLYKVKVGDDAYAVTQMEPISARRAFPGFDEPRFKVPFDIELTVPTDEVAVANTQQTAEKKSPDGKWKTLTFATTKPLPTYLVAFAVGPVGRRRRAADSAERRAQEPAAASRHRRRAARAGSSHWVLGETPAVIRFYEEYTHQPYPFDKLDLLGAPDFSAGAMENAGLIVYRDALLLIDELARPIAIAASSTSTRTRSRTSGTAISSRCRGGTTSGSTRRSRPGRSARRRSR